MISQRVLQNRAREAWKTAIEAQDALQEVETRWENMPESAQDGREGDEWAQECYDSAKAALIAWWAAEDATEMVDDDVDARLAGENVRRAAARLEFARDWLAEKRSEKDRDRG